MSQFIMGARVARSSLLVGAALALVLLPIAPAAGANWPLTGYEACGGFLVPSAAASPAAAPLQAGSVSVDSENDTLWLAYEGKILRIRLSSGEALGSIALGEIFLPRDKLRAVKAV